MKTYEIAASSDTSTPFTRAVLSTRSRCIFVANPLKVYSLSKVESETPHIPISCHVDCLRLNADERNIAIASNDVIKLIDLCRGHEIRNLSGHSLTVQALTPRWSSVYSWVSGSLDSSWIVWDSRSHPANLLQGRTTGPVRCVEMSPDDIILAVGTDSSLQLYDIRMRCCLKQFHSSTFGAAFHPSQRMIATYGLEKVVRFWCLDELMSVAMSDVFPTEIQCAKFANVSSYGDPVLVASTDHVMKTLTSEPCETLATNNIGESRKVLNLNVLADNVGVVCTDSSAALSYSVFSMEELLQGSAKSSEFSDTDESISDEVASITLRENSPSTELLTAATLSTSTPIHISSSDGRINHSLNGSNLFNTSARSSSTDGANSTRRFHLLKGKITRRADSQRSLINRPRSPSMSFAETHSHQHDLKTQQSSSSRLICRSVSPSNGLVIKDFSVTTQKFIEKITRLGTYAKSRRDLFRSVPSDCRSINSSNSGDKSTLRQRKVSSSGLSVNDFVAKIEKEHYMVVMQAEKTALGLQQLNASLKHGGISAMLKDGLFGDELAISAMLKILNEKKRWDINICNAYLPKLKEFLEDTTLPEACRQAALSSLQCIATGLLDALKSCSRAPPCTIGVDVAAEDRKQKAENCIKELRDLRDRRDQFYRRLSQDDVYRLDAIIAFLKGL
ncbi:hypothetical protein DICVIV_00859 [Dictyocaulus viviparus]|uniref:Katanin p80 subunit C-terminal domain-containing protein n=1 Tax=Dictyocaulus viviparus TaxID=29172 RepID=A0A0D8Y8C9_DICVI|nr:hypothetical protein DICVIV_00859 [Dictyocaulus viviparus]